MKKIVRNIIIFFLAFFFISSQVLAGSSYSCKMTSNGERICSTVEKSDLEPKILSNSK